jgi:hypothetical protein
MVIGSCLLHLYLPGVMSLKDKRSTLKPILTQVRREFEVAAAEVGDQDVWQRAEMAIVTVANDASQVYRVLDKAVDWIEVHHPHVQILDLETELR